MRGVLLGEWPVRMENAGREICYLPHSRGRVSLWEDPSGSVGGKSPGNKIRASRSTG